MLLLADLFWPHPLYASPSLVPDRSIYQQGEIIALHYTGFEQNGHIHWLSLRKAGGGDIYQTYQFQVAPPAGTLAFSAPPVGTYEFVFFEETRELSRSAPILVKPAEDPLVSLPQSDSVPATLALDSPHLVVGQPLTVSYQLPAALADKAALEIRRLDDDAWITYHELRGWAEGVHRFDGLREPGTYRLRLIHPDGGRELAALDFTLAPAPRGKLVPEKPQYQPGEAVRVEFTLPAESTKAFVWLVQADDPLEFPDVTAVDKLFLPETGPMEFAAPAEGRYELRMYSHFWGGVRIATAPLEVIPAAAASGTARYRGERILDFHSDIAVQPDASLIVTETLRVHAEGSSIRHGIYRDFPTYYRLPLRLFRRVGFEVMDVLRDGTPEPWHRQRIENGERLYLGAKDVELAPGEYSYTLRYRTDRQLGFFADHDELYWNVTGNGWVFPIHRASATVSLPGGGRITRQAAYTGFSGQQGTDWEGHLDEDGTAQFATTRTLKTYEGLTIVAGWDKGVIAPPGLGQRLRFWLRDFGYMGGLLVLVLGILAYYLVTWQRVGRDPAKRPVAVQFEPPETLCPASLRYLRNGYCDGLTLTAAILSLAVQGFVQIIGDEAGDFRLKISRSRNAREKVAASASAAEQEVFSGLSSSYPAGGIPLGSYQHSVEKAEERLKENLSQAYDERYSKRNWRMIFGGILLSLAILDVGYLLVPNLFSRDPLFVPLIGEMVLVPLCALLVRGLIGSFRIWIGGSRRKRTLLRTALVIWVSAWVAGTGAMGGACAWVLLKERWELGLFVQLVVLINLLFVPLLPARTVAGQRLLERIEGFRRFLRATGEERLSFLHPPERTPQLFERYLPYAIALDCEHAWTDQFGDRLTAAAIAEQSDRWFQTPFHDTTRFFERLPSTLSSTIAGAVSASTTAPGSSSGFGGGGSSGGGGGSSGGGGGGGGGGGW